MQQVSVMLTNSHWSTINIKMSGQLVTVLPYQLRRLLLQWWARHLLSLTISSMSGRKKVVSIHFLRNTMATRAARFSLVTWNSFLQNSNMMELSMRLSTDIRIPPTMRSSSLRNTSSLSLIGISWQGESGMEDQDSFHF